MAALGPSACAPDNAAPTDSWPAECADLPPVDWVSFGAGFFRSYCSSCHSSTSPDRHGAPIEVNLDSEAAVAAQSERVRARVLDSGDMPVGGGIPEDDLALLSILLDCGLTR